MNVVQWPQWFAAHGISLSPSEYALRFDRSYLALEAAAQGLGIALDSARLGERLLHKGTLVPVFKDRKAIIVHSLPPYQEMPMALWRDPLDELIEGLERAERAEVSAEGRREGGDQPETAPGTRG